jgi:hypothetical protein
MRSDPESKTQSEKKRLPLLPIITSIFAIAYLILIIDFFISEPQNLESNIVNFAFIIFLIGFYYSWRNEIIAGVFFVFWWGLMWYLGLYVAEHDKGAGVVMGVPIFIIGILFIISWYRKRGK